MVRGGPGDARQRAASRSSRTAPRSRRGMPTLPRWQDLVWPVAVFVPLVLAAVRLVLDGWWPSGDDALIALRATDVWSAHPPLMGQRTTSLYTTAGIAVHHPGPLQYYVLGLTGGLTHFYPVGLLLGGVLVGAGTCAAAAVAARRHLGRVAMAMTVVGALAITWRWGAAQLVRPYNLTATALPLLALLVLTWVLLAGGRRWTPLWVFVASWCAQTHIGLLPLVVLLAALLVVLRARAWWAGARRWLRDRALGRRSARDRTALWSTIVAVLVWLPVAIEPLLFRPSNVSELWRYVTQGSTAARRGWGEAVQYLAVQAASPLATPFVVSPDNGPRAAGFVLYGALGACVVVAVVGLARRTTNPASRAVLAGIPVALVATVVAAWSVARLEADRDLLYGSLFVPVPWFVFAVVVATVTTQLSRLPRRWRVGLVLRALSVAGMAVGLVGAVQQAVGDRNTGANPQVEAFSRTTADAVAADATPGQHVNIVAPGVQGFVELSPAVAYRLEQRGHGTSMRIQWTIPQDDDHRKNDNAPASSFGVLLRERTDEGWSSPRPERGRPAAQMDFAGGLGFPAARVVAWVGTEPLTDLGQHPTRTP